MIKWLFPILALAVFAFLPGAARAADTTCGVEAGYPCPYFSEHSWIINVTDYGELWTSGNKDGYATASPFGAPPDFCVDLYDTGGPPQTSGRDDDLCDDDGTTTSDRFGVADGYGWDGSRGMRHKVSKGLDGGGDTGAAGYYDKPLASATSYPVWGGYYKQEAGYENSLACGLQKLQYFFDSNSLNTRIMGGIGGETNGVDGCENTSGNTKFNFGFDYRGWNGGAWVSHVGTTCSGQIRAGGSAVSLPSESSGNYLGKIEKSVGVWYPIEWRADVSDLTSVDVWMYDMGVLVAKATGFNMQNGGAFTDTTWDFSRPAAQHGGNNCQDNSQIQFLSVDLTYQGDGVAGGKRGIGCGPMCDRALPGVM